MSVLMAVMSVPTAGCCCCGKSSGSWIAKAVAQVLPDRATRGLQHTTEQLLRQRGRSVQGSKISTTHDRLRDDWRCNGGGQG